MADLNSTVDFTGKASVGEGLLLSLVGRKLLAVGEVWGWATRHV